MAARSGRRLGRLLQKLDALVKGNEYYEAHQVYRTIFSRYLTQDLHQEAIQVAFDGATFFLSNEQVSSGTDMACLLIQAYNNCNLPVEDGSLNRISMLLRLMDSEEGSNGRKTFVHAAIEWSRKSAREFSHHGHPRVHRVCALEFWRCKEFVTARWHFLHADSPSECAAMLVEFSCARGHPREVDLFLAQAVLHLLVLQKVGIARRLFDSYIGAHPDIDVGRPPFLLPLLNFLWMLLVAVEQKLQDAFLVLRDKYAPSLNRDSTYNVCLDKIGTVLLGLPPSGDNFMGGLGDLFQSLFVGGGDDGSSAVTDSLEGFRLTDDDVEID